MNIKNRLTITVCVIFLSSVAMFAMTWFVTSGQKADGLAIDLANHQRMLSQKLAKEALAFQGTHEQRLRDGIQATATAFENSLKALNASGAAPVSLMQGGERIELPAPSPEVLGKLKKVRSAWSGYRERIDSLLAGKATDAGRLASESVELLTALDGVVETLQQQAAGRVSVLLVTQAACVGIGLVVLCIVLFFLRKNLTTPLAALENFAGEIAGGKLDAAIRGSFTGELADLKQSMEAMVANMRASMDEAGRQGEEARRNAESAEAAMQEAREQQSQVKGLLDHMSMFATNAARISHDVSESVVELGRRVDTVRQGTDVQRDRMTETATAMEEMNATVLEVARNAASASGSASKARENAQTGAQGVTDAVASIGSVKDQMFALNESMSELGEQAESIGNIMNVVSDIADQTNLLALNAAIEAARAGEAGRGFAVVADEVRKLAEKTMSATKEVGDAVQKIQAQARENVLAVEKSVEDIVTATEAATESGRFMNEIVEIVGDTAEQVESIATASEEQSAASEQINIAVTDVTRVATDTADGMEQATHALEAMVAMSTELDAVIRDMGNVTTANGKDGGGTTGNGKRSDRSGLRAADPKGLMQWADDLSVNVREIDEQHLRLIDLINALHHAMRSKQGGDTVARVLEELKDYTVFHFSTEERYFDRFGYQDTESHKKVHHKFVETVLDFEKKILSGEGTVTMEVMNFLKDWLVKHIKGTDQRYSAFLNDKGIY